MMKLLHLRHARKRQPFRCSKCHDALLLRRACIHAEREIVRLITDHEYFRFTSFGNPPPALVHLREVIARTRNLEP